MKRTWRSNCLVEALKQKFRHWNNIKLLPIRMGWHFHVMWYDKRRGIYRHFTHKGLNDEFTTFWFRGWIKSVKPEHLVKWMSKHGMSVKSSC